MTRAEALAEARRRWGPGAVVTRYRVPIPWYEVRATRYSIPFDATVGRYGAGPSWSAAFADADRRAGGAA